MSSFIAAFALQQLTDMEELQRDFGRQRTPRRRRAAGAEPVPSPPHVVRRRWHVLPAWVSQRARTDPNAS